jgi:hypothetical protein
MAKQNVEISIALTYAQTQTLISKASEGSPAWKVLMAAVPDFRIVDGIKVPPFAVIVPCDAASAAALKELARVHCPSALPAIELGIKEGAERVPRGS